MTPIGKVVRNSTTSFVWVRIGTEHIGKIFAGRPLLLKLVTSAWADMRLPHQVKIREMFTLILKYLCGAACRRNSIRFIT